MAKEVINQNPAPQSVTKGQGEQPANLVFHQLILRNIDRSSKDAADWRVAHRMAEAVLNPSRRKIFDLYEDVILDGHLSGIWRKRVTSVVNKKLMFVKNKEEDESFDELIKSKRFRQLRKKLMRIHSYGIVGVEFIPGEQFNFVEIPVKHIRPEKHLVTIDVDGEKGYNYQTTPNLWVLQNEDEPLGFLLKASPYALFKKGNYSDWAEFIEIFGQPVIITKYDGYDEKTRILLADALDSAGSSLRLMLPKQAEFEMKDGKTSNGDGKLQDTFKTAMNNELSILILGNTETTSSDNGGSNAKAGVQADQQLEITKDDMAEELMMLNDPIFLDALKWYGYNTDGGRFEYETEVDNTKLKQELEIDKMLEKDLGVPLGHDYYYEKYHRPKPDNYNELVAKKEEQRQQITNKHGAEITDDKTPLDDPKKKQEVKPKASMVEKFWANLFFDPAP